MQLQKLYKIIVASFLVSKEFKIKLFWVFYGVFDIHP